MDPGIVTDFLFKFYVISNLFLIASHFATEEAILKFVPLNSKFDKIGRKRGDHGNLFEVSFDSLLKKKLGNVILD